METYMVVMVGNIGCVYRGDNIGQAIKTYTEYVLLSQKGVGRAAGEDVVIFRNDGSLLFEFRGSLTEEDR